MRTRRDRYRPIIAATLEATKGQSEQVIKMALRAAFPDLPREHHPYKVWLDEIKVQRGVKPDPRRKAKQPVPYETIGDGDVYE